MYSCKEQTAKTEVVDVIEHINDTMTSQYNKNNGFIVEDAN